MSATTTGPAARVPEQAGVGRREFVGLIAACMGLTAAGIDTVLPAFGRMRSDFGLAPGSTGVSWVITGYFLGLAFGQLFYGPLSDRFGRKPLLTFGLCLYIVGAVAAALSPSLGVLVLFRVVSGLGAAGPRSLAIAMVRDRFEGAVMARTMSFAMAVFMIIPVVAPSLGALALRAASWPAIFWGTAVVAGLVLVWSRRLPETLPPARRRSSGLGELAAAARVVVRSRPTVAYGLAATFLFGSMAAYLGNSEVVIDEIYGRGSQFPVIFGALAVGMGLATLLSARLVVAMGVHRLLRTVSLLLVVGAAVFALTAATTDGRPPFWAFCMILALLLPLHPTLLPNCNTAAMGPVGQVAGTAAAMLGTVSTAGGAVLGSLIDGAYDGTLRPLAFGMLLFGTLAATLIHLAERRRPAPAR